MSTPRPDRDLIADLWSARIDRRAFIARAAAAGLSTAVVLIRVTLGKVADIYGCSGRGVVGLAP